MASLDFRVLSEIIRSRSLSAAIKAGLKLDHFQDPEAKQIFRFIDSHYRSRDTGQQVPLLETIQRKFPSF